MTRESVINQLIYYLNYGFISKELQEDIQEVLLKKKDIIVLERLLDSVEYELNKNTKNNYIDNIPNKTTNNLTINDNKIIKNNLLYQNTKKIENMKNNYKKFNNSSNPTDNIKQNDIVFIENNINYNKKKK